MSEAGEPTPEDEVIITVPVEMQAGLWANWAVVSESDHAFDESDVPSGRALDRHRSHQEGRTWTAHRWSSGRGVELIQLAPVMTVSPS